MIRGQSCVADGQTIGRQMRPLGCLAQHGIDADRQSKAALQPSEQGDSRPFASITGLILLPGKDRPTQGGIEFASSVTAFVILDDE
jgi:hypothetical protein